MIDVKSLVLIIYLSYNEVISRMHFGQLIITTAEIIPQ